MAVLSGEVFVLTFTPCDTDVNALRAISIGHFFCARDDDDELHN
jgi:hypothetical protein